ncbi:MAG: TetR/AcrR family transcriptional regulator [Chitinophagaceae bacterium]
MKAGKTPKKRLAKKQDDDISTEDKIKNAARIVFHKKGFAATRTRDIAEEAGINLALLNYYFRSKEKLFEIIMLESLQGFVKFIMEVFNDETTSLDAKIERFADKHIDLLLKNPGLPLFILSELRENPDLLANKIGNLKMIYQSHFMQQLQKGMKEGKITPINPAHLIINTLGFTAFSFAAAPLLKTVNSLSDKDFEQLMQERKQLVPKWIKATLKAK